MTLPEAPPFEEHFARSLEDLRASLTELYLAAGADPKSPQDVARRFGLHRNLTWKLARILRSGEPADVLPYLPGPAGLGLTLQAFRSAGVEESLLEAVDQAQQAFDQMVEVHAGDRATLELMLDSLGLGQKRDTLETSRELAFRGNSGVFGIQARTRLRTVFVAPNPERSELIDIAQISGLVDLRRFRHGVTWPLFQRRGFNDDGSPREVRMEPLDETLGERADTMLWTEFCSSPLPEVRTVRTPYGASYELVGGPVGNRGLMTCVYGGVTRAFAPRYRDEHNTRGEFYVDINAPTESLLFDLLVHVDVAQEIDVTADVLLGSSPSEGARALSTRIPVEEQVRRLESVPPRVSTPLVPRYEEIVRRVHERMGWAPASFRALRFEMKCPPLPSQIVLHYELPAGPRA